MKQLTSHPIAADGTDLHTAVRSGPGTSGHPVPTSLVSTPLEETARDR
jgi:hypothetical protein